MLRPGTCRLPRAATALRPGTCRLPRATHHRPELDLEAPDPRPPHRDTGPQVVSTSLRQIKTKPKLPVAEIFKSCFARSVLSTCRPPQKNHFKFGYVLYKARLTFQQIFNQFLCQFFKRRKFWCLMCGCVLRNNRSYHKEPRAKAKFFLREMVFSCKVALCQLAVNSPVVV